MSPRGGFPPPSRPRPVEGGLAARSTRGAIGEQWWSRRFVEVLESFALGSRLTRGRSYARRGPVVSLDVRPGQVAAAVQGSRARPYTVGIGLAPFTELVWAKVEVALAEQALLSAQLLAGELPAELEQVFAAAGAPLFPRRLADLALRCSCPDAAVPCKHLAATFYLLAESFDEDPFRILHWRGRERQALLGRLRALRGAGDAGAPTGASPAEGPAGSPVGAAAALAGVQPRPASFPEAAAFWEGAVLPPLPVHAELPVDLVLRQLPTPDATLGGAQLVTYLRPLYERLADGERP